MHMQVHFWLCGNMVLHNTNSSVTQVLLDTYFHDDTTSLGTKFLLQSCTHIFTYAKTCVQKRVTID